MSARTAASWQTSLADLSLILFMISAAGISRQEHHRREDARGAVESQVPHRVAVDAPEGTPLAVYIAAPGAPPLAAWLAQQAIDPRQRLTVTAPYETGPEDLAGALAEAGRLARDAGAAGRRARIVVEPGEGPARVVLAFDDPARAEAGVARSLLEKERRPTEGKHE